MNGEECPPIECPPLQTIGPLNIKPRTRQTTADELLLRKIETAHTTGETCVLSLRERERLQFIVWMQRERMKGAVASSDAAAYKSLYEDWARVTGIPIAAEKPKGLPTRVTPRPRKKRRR